MEEFFPGDLLLYKSKECEDMLFLVVETEKSQHAYVAQIIKVIHPTYLCCWRYEVYDNSRWKLFARNK